MKETKINYEEFVSRLRCRLYEIIPEDVNMEVNPVLKNNSLHLDSLVLFRQGSNCSPSFYLQDYYKKYTNGYDSMMVVFAKTLVFRHFRGRPCVKANKFIA